MKNNKGFSLVELIIVIAIMAILVGIMAPQLIKYIEKSNVAADIQLCDTIHSAMITAANDPEVLEDPASKVFLDDLFQASTRSGALSFFSKYSTTAYYQAVVEICGFDPFNDTVTKSKLKSTPASTSGQIFFEADLDSVWIYVEHSDKSGNKKNYTKADGKDKVIGAPTVKN